MNTAQWVRSADLRYNGTVSRSEEGLPIGNGRMGTLLWTSPSALKAQVNRVDVYANGPSSKSFPEVNTDYGYACAFVDLDFVDFGDDIFNASTSQHLDFYHACAHIKGNGISVDAFAVKKLDVFAFHINDTRETPSGISIKLKMLRPAEVQTGNHLARSRFRRIDDICVLEQVFIEGDYYCASAVAIGVVGRASVSRVNDECNGEYDLLPNRGQPMIGAPNETELRLCIQARQGEFDAFVSSAATFDPDVDISVKAASTLRNAMNKGYQTLLNAHISHWEAFWSVSYIHLWGDPRAKEIEKHYITYLYIMESCSRDGEFPPNFGGLLFSPRGDLRHWGNMQWWNNLSLTYNAALASGHAEFLEPYFSMYFNMLEKAEIAAKQQYGANGIFIGETTHALGLEVLPDNIAEELRDFFICEKPYDALSEHFHTFARRKNKHEPRWNYAIGYDAGSHWKDGQLYYNRSDWAPFSYVTHIFSSMACLAYHFYLYYAYTGDEMFLRARARPMIYGVSDFLCSYPGLRLEDGVYHVYYSNHDESFWGGKDSLGTLTAMYGLLPVAIDLSTRLGDDIKQRGRWSDVLKRLAPLPTNKNIESPHLPSREEDNEVWVGALGDGHGRMEDKIWLHPCMYFDLCNTQTKRINPEMFSIGKNSLDYITRGEPLDSELFSMEMSPYPRIFAGMGDGKMLIQSIYDQLMCKNAAREHCYYAENGSTSRYQNRLTAREGINAISAQRLGNAATGLQMGLLQSAGGAPGRKGVISVFPAWPKTCNASYRLWARDGVCVEAEICDGCISPITLICTLKAEIQIENPWGKPAKAVWNSGQECTADGDLISLSVSPDDNIIISPQ